MLTGIHGGDIYRNNVDLDFSANVNPLGINEYIKNKINVKIGFCEKYPDENQEKLRRAIAEREQVAEERILCGNGASELLLAVVHALRPREVFLPVPSFLGYERVVKAVDATPVFLPVLEKCGFLLDEIWVETFEKELEGDAGELANADGELKQLLVLTNPNNPTGRLIPGYILKRILNICLKRRINVILDECFIEFVKGYREMTMVKELERYPNLMILRAFTKYFAMPGIRLGYLMCSNMEIVNKIQMQLPEWNVSLLAQEAGVAALESELFYEETADVIAQEREFLVERMSDLFKGEGVALDIIPSDANFILFRTGLSLYDLLLEKRILIRDCSNYRLLEEGYYRIAVRSHVENQKLLEALDEILTC